MIEPTDAQRAEAERRYLAATERATATGGRTTPPFVAVIAEIATVIAERDTARAELARMQEWAETFALVRTYTDLSCYRCKVCNAISNKNPFPHAPDCPLALLEKKP